jgi:hypothetical protein
MTPVKKMAATAMTTSKIKIPVFKVFASDLRWLEKPSLFSHSCKGGRRRTKGKPAARKKTTPDSHSGWYETQGKVSKS